jgi:hypothetical protein
MVAAPKAIRQMHDTVTLPLQRTGHAMLDELRRYWDSRRLGRPWPLRRDIDPMAIPRLLPNVLLADVAPDGRFRFRVFGTALVGLRGGMKPSDPTGKWFDEIESLFDRDSMQASMRAWLDAPAALYRRESIRLPAWPMVSVVVHELRLPLTSDGARVDMMLSAIYPDWSESPNDLQPVERG